MPQTEPAVAQTCEHCKGAMVTKRIATAVPDARPVDLSLCKCDYLTCVHCGATVYDRAARRCVCGKDPGARF